MSKRIRLFQYLAVALLGLSLSGCFAVRGVFLGYPDSNDIHRFSSNAIESGKDCFQFKTDESGVGEGLKVNDRTSGSPYFVTLEELNNSRPVRSFLVIKNDTVLYSFYGKKITEETLHPSYSIAKSYTSALIGIAIKEGHINGVHDKVIDYIPELESLDGADKLEIEHLLNMTSGFKLKLSTDAVIYYGNNVLKALNQIEFAHAPGTYQEYININVQLLGLILHRSTGMKASEYLSQEIWQPINACSDAIWTIDKKGEDKTFCCMGATALDYAKFGRLYLNKGNWNGTQVVPEQWVETSLSRDTANGSSHGYNYLWHIGLKPYGDFMADGMYKQNIYVHPGKNIIIVVMCERDNKVAAERVRWRNIFRQIVDQL